MTTLLNGQQLENVPSIGSSQEESKEASESTEIQYHKGEFKSILRLVRVLTAGTEVKRYCDLVIDLCCAMQNLRLDIITYKEKATNADTPKHRSAAEVRGKNYLERYFYLITFTRYLYEQKDAKERFKESFESWVKSRPELYTLLKHIDLQ